MSEQHARLPEPSIWPVTVAVGVGMAAIGLITIWVVLLAGAIVTTVGLAGWIAQSLEESA